MLRHLRCSRANTANMIGTVTSAVRDTTRKAMLTKKLNAIAVSSTASAIRFARSSVTIGYASATAHSVNSWLWAM